MRVDLADLLTASGAAMAASNQRLSAAGAPALLKEFVLGLSFSATPAICADAGSILFANLSPPSAQQAALFPTLTKSVSITATFIAAPSLIPVKPT